MLTRKQRANLYTGKFPTRHLDALETGLHGTGHHNARRIEEKIKTEENFRFIFLIGGYGTGKTQIATYLSRKITSSAYITAHEYLDQLLKLQREEYQIEEKHRVTRRHRQLHTSQCLVIDEMTQVNGSDFSGRQLTSLLDTRYREKLLTILIGNTTRNEAEHWLTEPVLDRLNETGGIIECNWESYRK